VQVASFDASQKFLDKLPAKHKWIRPFKGGYHELWHEPDGVKEAAADEVISFIHAHSQAGHATYQPKL
jgi:acylglycerol lipase